MTNTSSPRYGINYCYKLFIAQNPVVFPWQVFQASLIFTDQGHSQSVCSFPVYSGKFDNTILFHELVFIVVNVSKNLCRHFQAKISQCVCPWPFYKSSLIFSRLRPQLVILETLLITFFFFCYKSWGKIRQSLCPRLVFLVLLIFYNQATFIIGSGSIFSSSLTV